MEKPGLTVEKFVDFFRKTQGWECREGTKIANDLTEFAKEREGSTRNIHELYVMFCLAKGINIYPNGQR
jgi:hypothetical protein